MAAILPNKTVACLASFKSLETFLSKVSSHSTTAAHTASKFLHQLLKYDPTGILSLALIRLEAGNRGAWLALATTALLGYIALCNHLRFKNRDAFGLSLGFRPGNRDDLQKMTSTQAQSIMMNCKTKEFPLMYMTGNNFTFFRIYGIPSISKMFTKTGELTSFTTNSKRLADTSVIVGTIINHAPTSDRSVKAIARLNYIHAPYIKSGGISNTGLAYTIGVIITEPVRWIEAFEWRSIAEYEKCAFGVFWKEVADGMNIDYASLLPQKTFGDGLEFYDAMAKWTNEYEAKHMKFASSNKAAGDSSIAMILHNVPGFAKEFVKRCMCTAMPAHLRESVGLPHPSPTIERFTAVLVEMRRFYLRYLSLPRSRFNPINVGFPPADPKTGRMHRTIFKDRPIYVQPTFWNRWGPGAMMTRLKGKEVPGDPGLCGEGYLWEEVGPRRVFGKGAETMAKMEEEIRQVRTGGCPFGNVM